MHVAVLDGDGKPFHELLLAVRIVLKANEIRSELALQQIRNRVADTRGIDHGLRAARNRFDALNRLWPWKLKPMEARDVALIVKANADRPIDGLG